MEFEHVGLHCQFDGCGQKDFLPFKCESCGKNLCLSHRSQAMHNCVAAGNKDMTSMDCPMCGESVKFSRSQDANLVWDDHYVNFCTEQLQKKISQKCFKPGCTVILGPSNTFTCRDCHQKVCLPHRRAEDHSCVGHIRKEFLEKFQKTSTPAPKRNSNNGTLFMPAKKDKPNKHKSNQYDTLGNLTPIGINNTNTLRGSAHRRIAQNENVATVAKSIPIPTVIAHHVTDDSHQKKSNSGPSKVVAAIPLNCPFCGLQGHSSEAILLDHIVAFHPDDSGNSNVKKAHTTNNVSVDAITVDPAVSTVVTSSNYNEICPVCKAKFSDAIELVAHFDACHSEEKDSHNNSAANSSSNSIGHNNNNHNSSSNHNRHSVADCIVS